MWKQKAKSANLNTRSHSTMIAAYIGVARSSLKSMTSARVDDLKTPSRLTTALYVAQAKPPLAGASLFG